MVTRHYHVVAAALHATRRFHERCGVELPLAEYDRMVRVIASGDAPSVAVTQDGIRIFHVRYGGATGYAVWKAPLKRIATFYPDLSWVTSRGGRLVREVVSA